MKSSLFIGNNNAKFGATGKLQSMPVRRETLSVLSFTLLAFLSLGATVLVFIYANSWLGLTIAAITGIWCLLAPFEFSVLVLPGFFIYSQIQFLPSISWSMFRIIFILMLGGMLMRHRILLPVLKKIPRYILYSLGLLLLAYLFSAFYNGWQSYTMERLTSHILRIGLILMTFAGVYVLKDPRYLFIGMTLQGFLMAAGGFYISNTMDTYMAIRTFDESYIEQDPILNMAMTSASYAAFSVSSGIAMMGLSTFTKRTWLKFVFYVGGVALIFSSMFSGRRQAVVAIVISAVIFLLCERSRRSIIFVVVLVAATLFLNSYGFFDEFFSARETIADELSGTGTGRLQLLQYGFHLLEYSPIFGIGPGAQPSYYDLVDSINHFSHNTFMSAALEGGIIGLVAAIYFTVGILVYFLKTVRATINRSSFPWLPLFLSSLGNIISTAFIAGDIMIDNRGLILYAVLVAYMVRMLESSQVNRLSQG